MILSEKIVALRKKFGWSQEELAEKLEVSRQSVSKWEIGAAIPDLDKIVKLSSLTGVSTDYLLKDDADDSVFNQELTPSEPQVEDGTVSLDEANDFLSLSRKVAKRVAMGLALVILSPFFFLLFEGLDGTGAFEDKPIPSPTIPGVPELQEEETFNNDTGTIGYYYPAEFNVVDVEDSDDADDFQIFNFSGNSMERIGALCFMLCVGGGLFLIIFNTVKLSKYKKMNSEIFSLAYGVEGIISKRKSENESAYNTCLTVGIVLCAVPILPVILEYLNIINRVSQSVVDFYGCASLVLLAVGAYLILSTCIIRNSYSKILQIGNYTPANKAAGKAGCSKFGFYWLFVGVIFLAISYFFKSWEKSWLLWPLAVVIFIFLNQIFGVVEKKD